MRPSDISEGYGPVGTNGAKKSKPEPPDRSELKESINNLVWMYADPDLTLHEAEQRSIRILELICAPVGSDNGSEKQT